MRAFGRKRDDPPAGEKAEIKREEIADAAIAGTAATTKKEDEDSAASTAPQLRTCAKCGTGTVYEDRCRACGADLPRAKS